MNFRGSIVSRTLSRKYELQQSKKAFTWSIINLGVAILIYCDMHQQFISTYFELSAFITWYTELFFFIVFCINAIVDIVVYTKGVLLYSPIELTAKQKQLLAVRESESGFTFPQQRMEPARESPTSFGTTPLLTSTPFVVSGDNRWSPSSSPVPANSSWLSYSDGIMRTPVNMSPYKNYNDSSEGLRFRTPSCPATPPSLEDSISDEATLAKYLKDCDEKEQKAQIATSESPKLVAASFWNLGHSLVDYSSLFRKYSYQVASRSLQTSVSHPDDDSNSPPHHAGEDVWQRLGVNSNELFRWTKNLRQWLALTVLDRLVDEIDSINDTLRRMGSSDLQIGEVTLTTLRQVSVTKSQLIPTLNVLLPYLEISPNQEYLVQRIRELSRGGCMSDYIWNGGGKFKGKPWGDHLPSDSAIVMHLFCTYLDSRLPIHPNYPDGKTFTNQCFVRSPDKPVMSKEKVSIYQTRINPPHFKLIIGEEVWDLTKGRNNLFHTLLLFLLHIKTKENGMLGRVNLGLSGINILWILD